MFELLFNGDLIGLIKMVGYLGVFFIIFAESGLFFGFFLPGDSLLFTVGFLASQGFLNLWTALALIFIAAVSGDSVGYAFGRKVGQKLFNREESFFFKKEKLIMVEKFYEKNGPKTIVIARFMPIVRTFAPIVAGVGKMDYKKFVTYNLAGGALWTIGLVVGGYFLGKIIPDADKYLMPIIILIIIASVLPTVVHVVREKLKK